MKSRTSGNIFFYFVASLILFTSPVSAGTYNVQTVSGRWNLIGFSCASTTATPSSFTGISPASMFQFSQGTYAADVSAMTTSRGYWIFLALGQNLASVTCGAAVSVPSVDLSLPAGWNLIANPFVTAVTWDQVTGRTSVSSGPWEYNPTTGAYAVAGSLAPWKAYWVKMSQAGTLSLSNPGGVELQPPGDVAASPCGPTKVCLSFTPQPGTATNIYVGDSMTPINTCPVEGDAYNVGGLDSGENFNFRLTAVDQLGQESSLASEQQGNTAALEPGSGGAVGGRVNVSGACTGGAGRFGRSASAVSSVPTVTVKNKAGTVDQQLIVDEFGNFEIASIPPGTYEVSISQENASASGKSELNGKSEAKNITVEDAKASGLGGMEVNGFADILVNAAHDKIFITDYYYGMLFVIDGNNYTATVYEDTDDLPWALTQNAGGDKVYVSTLLPFGQYNIYELDPATDLLTNGIHVNVNGVPGDSLPWGMDFNSISGYIYLADLGLGQVAVIDPNGGGTLVGSWLDVGLAPVYPHVDYDLGQIYVNFMSGIATGYDILTIIESTQQYIPVTVFPGNPFQFSSMTLNRAEHSAYFIGASQWLDGFQFLKLTQTETIPLNMPLPSLVPWSVGVDESRNRVYISCFTDDASGIIVLNGETLYYTGDVIETMNDYSEEPPGVIKVDEQDNKIYAVQNLDGYTLLIIDGDTNQLINIIDLYAYLQEYYDKYH